MVVHIAQHRRSNERGVLHPGGDQSKRLYIEEQIDTTEALLQLVYAGARCIAEERVNLVLFALSGWNGDGKHFMRHALEDALEVNSFRAVTTPMSGKHNPQETIAPPRCAASSLLKSYCEWRQVSKVDVLDGALRGAESSGSNIATYIEADG